MCADALAPYDVINPSALRLETALVCQLRCPLCPTTRNDNLAVLGRGVITLEHFRRLLAENPQIRTVEIANFGEVFLNKDLPRIFQAAHELGVEVTIDEGANLNSASDEALEALVKYRVSVVRCAIDGVTQEVYQMYRARGDLRTVLANIQKINAYKKLYGSTYPRLIFQFIIFGHNEHQIEAAIKLAKILRMKAYFKLNFFSDQMPVVNRERVRSLLGYADREEYLQAEGQHYKRHQCYEMWNRPQVNWDGRLVGCSRNMWGVYAENVFEGDLPAHLNNEKIRYARRMLMGQEPNRADMPCNQCSVHKSMVETGNWITPQEIEANSRISLPESHP